MEIDMKKIFILILAPLLLTGCNLTTATDSVTKQEQSTPIQQTEKESSEKNNNDHLVKIRDKSFTANGKTLQLTDDEWKALLTAFVNLQESEPALPKENGTTGDSFAIYIKGQVHNISQINGKYSSYISVDSNAEYFFNDEFRQLFKQYCTDETEIETEAHNTANNPEDRLLGLSVECDEPKNPDEYLETARAVVKPWLDSLKSEEGQYKLSSYTFTDKLADNRVFHGDGYINGAREFVCYVGFDTPTKDEDTVFYASGTYDTFYHYYFGPGILARFRWENGVCRLVKYDEAFSMLTSDNLKDGLYGMSQQEMKYKTFYDFSNDKDNVKEWLEKNLRSKLCTHRVSHNVMMLSNGNIVFMDIGNSRCPEYNGDFVTTDMSQYFYDPEKGEKYSSPVDFIDGSGAVVMTYRQDFQIIYDDYNHDGNPDYTIRISSDDYGSTYDVRCMDINGTPWEDQTEVYVYGEFDESIRLQLYSGTSILKPVDNGNGGTAYEEYKLFDDKSNTSHDDVTEGGLTDYRMYSQRFYLPESLRCYSKEDKEVICYLWNNTDKAITLDENYEIQRKNNNKWETVGTGSTNRITVNGGEYAEVNFDITSINSDEISLYRIKADANKKAVYGGFYYGNQNVQNLEITSESYPSELGSISFEIVNNGLSAVYLDSAALYQNGEKLCDIDINDIGRINSGSSHTLIVTEDDVSEPFSAGEYTLELVSGEAEFSGKARVINVPRERLFYFPEKVTARKSSDMIKIPLKNNIWNEEKAILNHLSPVEVMNAGVWFSTTYFSEILNDSTDNINIEFGDTIELSFINDSYMLDDMKDFFNEMKNYDYSDTIDEDEFAEISSMTFDEFVKEILNISQPQKGDLCRICINIGENGYDSEYVYFEMP